MAAISVRGLDEAQLDHLKEQARQQGISLNRLALHRLIGQSPATDARHQELDHLAGTWSEEEAEAFAAAIAPLEQIDPELWA
ncbi:MAG: hypothetical protein VKM97_04115 [Cyanobacteriota bacterium]|nr:hypothetical protein [Cyanobacteriota bacterium]